MAALDLAGELNTLLEAERAGARVGAALVKEAEARGAHWQDLAKVVHDDEVHWARALFEALHELGVEPSDKVGDFYERAMAIEGFEARLAFVNRGQGWVVRKLREILPGVSDPALKATLQDMLDRHVVNIDAANAALAGAGFETRPAR
jgi:nitronate monooxygenase